MKNLILLVAGAVALTVGMALGGIEIPAERLEARREFSELKFGIFLHWGIPDFAHYLKCQSGDCFPLCDSIVAKVEDHGIMAVPDAPSPIVSLMESVK